MLKKGSFMFCLEVIIAVLVLVYSNKVIAYFLPEFSKIYSQFIAPFIASSIGVLLYRINYAGDKSKHHIDGSGSSFK